MLMSFMYEYIYTGCLQLCANVYAREHKLNDVCVHVKMLGVEC